MKTLIAVFAITVLLLPLALNAEAQKGGHELSVTLKVTNTKTGEVRTKTWDMKSYTFTNKIPIDVPDYRLKKISRIFGTDTFAFTVQDPAYRGEWLHFKVELVGTVLIGKSLSVRFV